MKKKYVTSWKRSKRPNKQRKYRFNAPQHVKSKMICTHLSQELRKKYKKRSVRLRKGDTVKIMRGQFRGKIGKVDKVNVKKEQIFVEKIEMSKKEGSTTMYPFHPSNLLVITLNLDDKKRQALLKST